jgi:hypothetical protein
MSEENKTIEQEQEHVSENPEVKDTEHVESAEVPPEVISAMEKHKKGIDVNSEAPATNDEINPHEPNVDKITEEANKIIREHKKKEGDENSSVYIDMSKIVMDKEGIPEITKEDIRRLKDSDITLTNFEFEINDARDIIHEVRELLNEDSQKNIEKDNKEQIEKIDARLKEINALKEEELTDEIKKEKEDIENAKSLFADEVANLPIHNEKIKNELLKREANAKKLIATYQNVARYDLGQLQNDGTIVGLISNTANTAFAKAFIDTMRIAKGEPAVEDVKEIKEITKKIEMADMGSQISSILHDAIVDIEEGNIDKLVAYMKKDYEKEYSKEVQEKIDYKGIAKVPELINKISSPNAQQNERNKLYKEYQEIRNSIITLDDPDKEFEELKNARREADEFFEGFEKFSRGKISINQYYSFLGEKPLEKLIPEITKDTNVDEIKEIINTIKPKIEEKYNKDVKQNEENEEKLAKLRDEIIKPYKAYLIKYGLFNGFISYAFANSEKRGYYARPESCLEFQHVKTYSRVFYDVIKMNMKSVDDKEYDQIKLNVNSMTMFFNNIIRYYIDIYENNIDLEWAANFDPDSVLKNFYYDHKEELDKFIKEYIDTVHVVSHLLCHNVKFKNAYEKFMDDIVKDINANEYKLKKLDENKKINNKYEFKTDIAFEYQFVVSYKKFMDLSEPINEADNKKREENPEIKFEEFDKWYKETQLNSEHEATRSVISSLLHTLVGCSVIYGFTELDDYFASKNKNKNLRHDCVTYFFNEYILESFAFRNCPKDKTYEEYIRDRSKTIAFQSLDYTYQRDIDIEKSRLEAICYIFGYATNSFKVLIDNICGDKNEPTKEEIKKDNKKKKNTKAYNEMIKSYKEKSKEKKKNLGAFKNALKTYDEIIKNIVSDTSIIKYEDTDNIYDISVYPSKDTKVVVRVERYAKKILDENVKKVFGTAIIKDNDPVDVRKAFVASKKVSNDNLTNINEKWYYNQFVEGKLAVRDGKDLSYLDKNTYTLSERCRNTVNVCLKNSYDKIIKNAIDIIKHTGVNFDGKSIAVKNNCKFDIKYFKSNNPDNFFDGNLNFYKAGIWDIISFELNYDIVNEKK